MLVELLTGELRGEIKSLCGAMIVGEGRWEEAIALSRSTDAQLAFRAAWGLEWAWAESPEGLRPHLETFLYAFARSDNGSVHRIYSKMINDMLRRGWEFSRGRRTEVVAKSFDLLIDSATRPAVKVWSMEIVYRLRGEEPWIADALAETLAAMLTSPEASPGLVNRASKTLKRLAK
ncbi:MAG: hypothetical protein LBH06_01005 [Rikenellaceae bacterium]|jgi:hypothetical protein|nr:hypothetical protein [Rikenellaceae bacterium]